jgi:hypothetical protein
MKKRYVIYGFLLLGLFAFVIRSQMLPTSNQREFLRRVHQLRTLNKIIIKFDESPKGEETAITNTADLLEAQDALHKADLRPVSGHSGAIFESTIVFIAESNVVLKARATIHKNEPGDLFLSPDLPHATKTGALVLAGIPTRIRVPMLGGWVARELGEQGSTVKLNKGVTN